MQFGLVCWLAYCLASFSCVNGELNKDHRSHYEWARNLHFFPWMPVYALFWFFTPFYERRFEGWRWFWVEMVANVLKMVWTTFYIWLLTWLIGYIVAKFLLALLLAVGIYIVLHKPLSWISVVVSTPLMFISLRFINKYCDKLGVA